MQTFFYFNNKINIKKYTKLPIKTGPGSSGDVTSLDFTSVPSGNVISLPDFNRPSNGPGGTLCLTHWSKSKNPGFGLRRHTYAIATALILFTELSEINFFSSKIDENVLMYNAIIFEASNIILFSYQF